MTLDCSAGDHEQLRPKAEEYKLTVASKNGYDLDLSLFERLQQQGFPVASLVSQRRMQPTISALIKASVYPDLQVPFSLLPSTSPISSYTLMPADLSFQGLHLSALADFRDLSSLSLS